MVIGIGFLIPASGETPEGPMDLVVGIVEGLGLAGNGGFRIQALIGTVLILGGLTSVVMLSSRWPDEDDAPDGADESV